MVAAKGKEYQAMHSAKMTFQALRIHVNREFHELKRGMYGDHPRTNLVPFLYLFSYHPRTTLVPCWYHPHATLAPFLYHTCTILCTMYGE